MSDDLRSALTDIHGIGEAKADEIIEVYEEWGVAPIDQILQDIHENLEQAVDHHDAGQHEYAAKFTRRAYELTCRD